MTGGVAVMRNVIHYPAKMSSHPVASSIAFPATVSAQSQEFP
jgi:hypothetical protein